MLNWQRIAFRDYFAASDGKVYFVRDEGSQLWKAWTADEQDGTSIHGTLEMAREWCQKIADHRKDITRSNGSAKS